MTDREAMKLALEWMNKEGKYQFATGGWAKVNELNAVITALHQALEQPEHQPWCASLNTLLLSHPPQPAKCNCRQPEQEPVAWMYTYHNKKGCSIGRKPPGKETEYGIQNLTPLYTAPPKREFIGLTDEEIAEGAKQSWVHKSAFESAVWWAEFKLKEKNR